jgi:hypothetical protein
LQGILHEPEGFPVSRPRAEPCRRRGFPKHLRKTDIFSGTDEDVLPLEDGEEEDEEKSLAVPTAQEDQGYDASAAASASQQESAFCDSLA